MWWVKSEQPFLKQIIIMIFLNFFQFSLQMMPTFYFILSFFLFFYLHYICRIGFNETVIVGINPFVF